MVRRHPSGLDPSLPGLAVLDHPGIQYYASLLYIHSYSSKCSSSPVSTSSSPVSTKRELIINALNASLFGLRLFGSFMPASSFASRFQSISAMNINSCYVYIVYLLFSHHIFLIYCI